jgi:hypothetical protein
MAGWKDGSTYFECIFEGANWPYADHSGHAVLGVNCLRSDTGVVDLNLTRDMGICIYSVFVMSSVGNGLAAG